MHIAYLAPEITGLSATFVYKEILRLKDRGYSVTALSVHPSNSASAEDPLSDLDVTVLYQKRLASYVVAFFSSLIFQPKSTTKGFVMLLQDIKNVQGVKQKFKLLYQYLTGVWASKQLRKRNVEHLHIHFGHVPTQIGMYAAVQCGCDFSFTVHANDLFQRPLLYRTKALRAKAVVTISNFNVSKLIGLGVPEDRIRVIRCGIDYAEFPFQPKRSIVPPLKLLVVARLVQKKGIDTLIRAIKQIQRKGVSVSLKIIGDGPELNSLIQLTDHLDVTDEVTFMGAIENKEIASLFSHSDIFVLPCRIDENGDMDGVPVVLMEAMSFGIPVISTNISGIPELVIDGKTGLLVQPDDAEQLVAAILKVAEDQELRQRLVHAAHNHIKNEFSIDRNIDLLMEVFKE